MIEVTCVQQVSSLKQSASFQGAAQQPEPKACKLKPSSQFSDAPQQLTVHQPYRLVLACKVEHIAP